jgi:hypothetical protein
MPVYTCHQDWECTEWCTVLMVEVRALRVDVLMQVSCSGGDLSRSIPAARRGMPGWCVRRIRTWVWKGVSLKHRWTGGDCTHLQLTIYRRGVPVDLLGLGVQITANPEGQIPKLKTCVHG